MYRAVWAVWQLLEFWTSTTSSKHMLSLQSCSCWRESARKNQNALFAQKLKKPLCFIAFFDSKTEKEHPAAPRDRWEREILEKF